MYGAWFNIRTKNIYSGEVAAVRGRMSFYHHFSYLSVQLNMQIKISLLFVDYDII